MENNLFGYKASILSEDGHSTKYSLPDTDKEVLMNCYRVFPGIYLVYDDVHASYCNFERSVSDTVFEIQHCREGRVERTVNDDFFYIGPGDLSVSKPQSGFHTNNYPLHHYHGITIIIDTEKAPNCLSCFLEDVNVKPKSLMEKFCSHKGIYVARSLPSIQHIFNELYSVPDSIRLGYLKVKILELMLFLTSIDIKTDELSERSFSHTQKSLAENVSDYLLKNMDSKISLDCLTDVFHVSGTQIKNSIKAVYGVSLYNMIRVQKMQSAAEFLTDTDLTISEIAGKYGYDNASKFASAFKAVMGLTPKEYRNSPVKIENIYI